MKKNSFLFLALIGVALAIVAASWGCSSPSPAAGKTTRQTSAVVYTCPMHPTYRSDHAGDCPMCGMRLVPAGATGGGTGAGLVQLDAVKQQVIGVRIDEVRPAAASRLTLRVPGRVAVDDQRAYRITAAVDGWIRQLGYNPPGTFVRKHEVLAAYYAQNLVAAVTTYVFAVQTNDQAQTGDATIGYQRGPTKLSLQQTLDSLRALGMSDLQIEEINRTHVAPTDIRVYSPIDGYVVARGITPEQRFDKGTEMFRIADIGHVWVLAEVFERDSAFLKPGTRAAVLYEGRRLEARMSNALPQFDPQTRTLKTRFDLDNPGNLLRPDMFVDVEISADMPAAVTVSSDAVVDSGLRKVVFVDRGNGYFEPRRVETGWRMGDRVQITKGVMAGERVVVSGNFLLDSESRMKSAAMGIYNPETDPVCGMDVDHDAAVRAGRTTMRGGTPYYFCSDDCKRKFEADPGKYAEGRARGADGGTKEGGESTRKPAAGMARMPEVKGAANLAAVKDPVCGMDVDPNDPAVAARKVEYKGKAYFFCSDDCKTKFEKNPTAYVNK